MKTNTYSVYVITNSIKGKMYFGITKRPVSKRMSQHRKMANQGSEVLISRAIRKYGWDNFTVEVLHTGLSKERACEIEISLIKEHRSCYEKGYNMEIGGQHGISVRPETKRRTSEAAKRNWENNEKVRAVVSCPKRNSKIGLASKKNWQDPSYRALQLERLAKMVEASLDPECRKRAVETFIKNGNNTMLKCSNGMVFNTTKEAERWVRENTPFSKASNSTILRSTKTGGRAYGFRWERV